MRHVLIIGLGYLGQALARHLQAGGWRVTGWVRSEETAGPLREAGFSVHTGDVASAADWSLPLQEITHVVHCASSSQSGPEVYAQVYREGMRQMVAHLPNRRTVFVSSTSVYAQTDGAWVDENSLAEPAVETGKILREAESITQEAGGIVARVGGIYGPGRGVLLKKYLAGEAVIEGDGLRWINQVHRDDIATGIECLLSAGENGAIYNVTDSRPCTYVELYEWLSRTLERPLPPYGPVNAHRKRGLTNKRVRNARLLSLGWIPLYPSFQEGYGSLVTNNQNGK
jgi:nucleoside-diphosphate-sugar epimerase